jgi:ATP-dependent helicase/nuclease subunit B
VKGANAETAGFEYWSLGKSADKKRSNPFGYAAAALSKNAKGDAPINETFVAFVEHEARTAIALWITGNEPFTAKLKPDYAVYDDYDQLMRLDEWRGQGSWQEGDDG